MPFLLSLLSLPQVFRHEAADLLFFGGEVSPAKKEWGFGFGYLATVAQAISSLSFQKHLRTVCGFCLATISICSQYDRSESDFVLSWTTEKIDFLQIAETPAKARQARPPWPAQSVCCCRNGNQSVREAWRFEDQRAIRHWFEFMPVENPSLPAGNFPGSRIT